MILYGHRGARNEAPENTLAGFAHGLASGLRAFELDVRLTADGFLAVMHDATVDRTTDGTGAVADFTSRELKELDARGPAFPDWPVACTVPLLDEVIEALPGDITFEIEIKHDTPARLEAVGAKLAATIEAYGMAGRVTITSFDPEALVIMRRLAPELARGYIGSFDQPHYLATALDLECARAGIHIANVTPDAVRAVCDRGLFVTGWPGNTVEQLETLLAWPADGITTDNPAIALPFLRSRGIPAF